MFGRTLKGLTKPKSELDGQLKEAMSKESWGAPNSLLQDIAIASEDDADRLVILQAVWKTLECKDKEWRRVLKALALIEVILKRGCPRIIEDIKQDQWRIQKWQDTRIMEDGKDVASGIREKCKNIIELLGNPAELNKQRQKNHEMYEKFQGVGVERRRKGTTVEQLAAMKDKAVDQMTGGKAALEAETEKRQRQTEVYLKIQEFKDKTGAPENVARHFLKRHHGHMEGAIGEFQRSQQSSNGQTTPRGQASAPSKPRLADMRQRCDQVRSITEVSEKDAMQVLEQCGWDVEKAIERAFASAPSATPKNVKNPRDAPAEDSDSDSDESSDESSDEEEAPGKGHGKGFGKGGKGFNASVWGGQTGPNGYGAGPNHMNGQAWGNAGKGDATFGGMSGKGGNAWGGQADGFGGKGAGFNGGLNAGFHGQQDARFTNGGQNINAPFGKGGFNGKGNSGFGNPQANGPFGGNVPADPNAGFGGHANQQMANGGQQGGLTPRSFGGPQGQQGGPGPAAGFGGQQRGHGQQYGFGGQQNAQQGGFGGGYQSQQNGFADKPQQHGGFGGAGFGNQGNNFAAPWNAFGA